MVSPAELYQDKFDLTAGLFITWHKVLVLIWTEILPTELKQVCVCACEANYPAAVVPFHNWQVH